ncbi:PREDICTED: uncharacterized protein LOC109218526 [Nicotiana attenuata]|uniref:uncharacterized protein LOC109218526 n=1 Tax=Nicotiana attenuata TaxID=49451 RepID=UPI000905D27B|nr:PREDICTED: uncharacterized protein LOC109218526 [Nicotiana attenuata]
MVLLEYGIPAKFVDLIMECVMTVSYSLLLNGGMTPKFQAKKIMCCRADRISMQLILQAFHPFSDVTGLQANMEKSSFYVAGVTEQFKASILSEMHFALGEFPFKYLGVPLSTKKPSTHQCMPLVFLLPKKILHMITTACRTFLWTGSNEPSKRASVSGERMCMPGSTGGLRIMDFYSWNKASLCKLLWAINAKKDILWVKWIHNSYIKRRDAITMPTPKRACWIVRKVFDTREWFGSVNTSGDVNEYCKQGKFSIKKVYIAVRP